MHPTHWLISTQVLACLSGVAWGRYQVAYLNSLGIAPSTLGALRAAGLAAKFFCTPLWGAWADARPGVAPLLAAIAATASLIRLYQSPTVVGSLPLLFALKAARSAANGLATLTDALTLRVERRRLRAHRVVRLEFDVGPRLARRQEEVEAQHVSAFLQGGAADPIFVSEEFSHWREER